MRKVFAGATLVLSILGILVAWNQKASGENTPAVFSSRFDEQLGTLAPVKYSEVAHGWMRDNWGNNITGYSWDPQGPHSGAGALRIRCLWWNSGMAAALSRPFRIREDKTYVLRLWLRAESLPSDRSVQVTVRTAAQQGDDLPPLPDQRSRQKWETHASRRCSASGDWREFTLDIKAKYDCDVEIQLGFESVGTIWVDDISVVEGSVGKLWLPAPASKDPPRKGNLLYNGSFEVGLAGWGPVKWEPLEAEYSGKRHRDVRGVEANAPHGRFVMRVDSTEWIESEFLRVRPGYEITLSAYMKTEEQPMSVSLSFLDGSQIQYVKHASYGTACKLTNEWKRFSVSGRLPASANNGIVVRIWGGSGPFLVDGVQVEEGSLSPFAPGGDVEVGLTKLGTNTGIYRPGETSKVRIHAYGMPDVTVNVTSCLEDYYGRKRQTFDTAVKLDSKGTGWADVDVLLPAPGIYRLISEAEGTARPGEIILAQVKPATAAYGGIHARVTRFSLDFVRDSGFAWWRLHDCVNPFVWSRAEPERGKFYFDENAINRRLQTGARILACLYKVPEWAIQRGQGAPEELTVKAEYYGTTVGSSYHGAFLLEDWKNYVRHAVRRYKDRIGHWEIWNEPSGMPPAEYFKLLKGAYTVIKEEDPEALVVGGGGLHSYAAAYVESLLAMGALDYMDAYSFHGYMVDGAEAWEFGRGLRELMKKHGKVVPFWDTEWGQQCNTFRRVSFFGGQSTYRWPTYPYRTAVNSVVRHELAERALDVKVNFWYPLGPHHPIRDDSGGLLTLIEYDNSPRATLAAIANTWDLLGRAKLVEMLKPSAIARLYTFQRPEGTLFAVDTKLPEGFTAGMKLPVDLPAVHVNVMGERERVEPRDGSLELVLSDEPVMLLFEGAEAKEIAQAAQHAEFTAMMPEQLQRLLVIDHRNRVPAQLNGATYQKELQLGLQLSGWLMRKDGIELMVFAGQKPANTLQSVYVSEPRIQIHDSLGNEVPVSGGKAVVICGAPYIATGPNILHAISDGSMPAGKTPRNLLTNGSFEKGRRGQAPPGWAPWKRFGGKSTFSWAKGGRRPQSRGMAVLVQSPDEQFVMAEQGITSPLKAGQRYVLSVMLRADRPIRADVYIEGRTYGKDGKPLKAGEERSRFELTTTWARYTSVVTIKEGIGSRKDGLRAIVQLFETPGTRVEIDDAAVFLLEE